MNSQMQKNRIRKHTCKTSGFSYNDIKTCDFCSFEKRVKCRPTLVRPNSVAHCRSVHLRPVSLAYMVQHEIASGRSENLHFLKDSKFLKLHYYLLKIKINIKSSYLICSVAGASWATVHLQRSNPAYKKYFSLP